ncbi:MAG: LysM peptidoglycan-binding domain-containing protein [Peptococcaceae bacterium]|nr:LysM peptidoglycan-binding domain-containing protein [Peptococcaceae bacterium]
MPQFYTVRPGDTLSSIASHFGTTVQNLAALNQIANPDVISVGQTLLISLEGEDAGDGSNSVSSRVIDGLLYVLATNRNRYRRGETVNITLSKTNVSRSPRRLFYTTGQRFDFEAVRADGTVAWRWSEGRVFTQETATIILQPGESQTFRASWDQRDRQGNLVAPQTITIRGFNWAQGLRNRSVSTDIVIARTVAPTPTPTPRPPAACQPGVNLLRNAGFENWPDPDAPPPGWAGENVSRLEFIRHLGRYSARLGANPRRRASLTQAVATMPGRVYRLAYWVREILQVPAGSNFIFRARVFFYNAAGQLVSTADPEYTETTVPESFIQFSFTTGRVPAAARTMEVRFLFSPERGNTSAVALDDVFLECLF